MSREADLIEEVGRVLGYDRIPPVLPRIVGRGRRTDAQRLVARLAGRAADLGLFEAVTYRFVPESDADRLRLAADDPRRDVVRLANPISEDMAVMRRSMLPGLLRAAARNQRRQRPSGGLFETGRTYAPRPDGLADEREWLATLVFGPAGREHWRGEPLPNDVWAALGVAEALTRAAGVTTAVVANAAPYFHPVRQARLEAGGVPVAWAGEVHPLVLRAFDVTGPATAVVVDLGALAAAVPRGPRVFAELATAPASTRDLAVVVPDGVAAADLLATARQAGAPLVRDARVFDRYAGAQVGEGLVSLAIRLTVADPARTLTEPEIAGAVEAVRDALQARHGARLRT